MSDVIRTTVEAAGLRYDYEEGYEYTQCPKCGTWFLIRELDLDATMKAILTHISNCTMRSCEFCIHEAVCNIKTLFKEEPAVLRFLLKNISNTKGHLLVAHFCKYYLKKGGAEE